MDSTRGLVSVVIPSYNRGSLVSDAIEGVLRQGYPDIQIIVVDDGSRDNTRDVVRRFSGVEYYYQRNQGQSAAWRHGLRHVMGEYVALLDSDDVWGDGFLSASIGAIEAYDCDLVWSNYRIVSLSGEIDCENQFREQRGYLAQYRNSGGPWHLVQGQAATKLFSRRLPLIPSAAVMRRRFAQIEPAEWVRAGPDLYFFPLNVLRSNQRVAFGDEVAWTQRIGTNNIRQGSNKQRSLLESDIQVKQALHSDPLWDVCERQALADRIADDLFSLSYHERLDGAFKPAVEHLLESFWLRPNFWMAKELAKIAWTAAASVIRPD